MVKYNPNYKSGLSKQQVAKRIESGLINKDNSPKTKTIGQIIRSNTFTYFNFLNVILSFTVLIVGTVNGFFFEALKNSLFLGVIFCNTLIGIAQEIISKKIVDKLSLLSEVKVSVIRDSKEQEINYDEIVLDDVMILRLGRQVVCDAKVLDGEVEVNESFITGEANSILKKKGDDLLSGSFIVSGTCYAVATKVGDKNYISEISKSAKEQKKDNSIIMNSINIILKIISFVIIPLGVLLFYNQMLVTDYNYTEAVFNTVGGVIGMIPEGLILLTSSVMAVGIIRLYRYHVLIQRLYSVETLARIDTICLDKTGTITTGNMTLEKTIVYGKHSKEKVNQILSEISFHMDDETSTFKAIKKVYNKQLSDFEIITKVPFSSKRKYSSITFKKEGTFFLGAPEFILKDEFKKIKKEVSVYQKEYRVLILAKETSKEKEIFAILLIKDEIRKHAMDTLNYFKDQDVKVKIISGDNLDTIMHIAGEVGLTDIKGVDANTIIDFNKAAAEYDIFARVKPNDKKKIISALKKAGHVVGYLGDGVNDCMALREADISLSVANGSDAARNVSEVVLLDSDFASIPKIVLEGRRIINNVERSASLLLMKTFFTFILILICIFTSQRYFFLPIQLSLVNFFNIGVPSFFLALEPNKNRVSGNFLVKTITSSLPTSLTVVINIIIVTLLKNFFGLSEELSVWLNLFLTSGVCFIFLYKISKPLNLYRGALFAILSVGFLFTASYFHDFFDLPQTSFYGIILFILFMLCSYFILIFFEKIFNKLSIYLNKKIDEKRNLKKQAN